MKKYIKLVSIIVLFLGICAFKLNTLTELEIGAKVPKSDLKMMDVSGKEITLTDVKQQKGLLVIFSCNTCPYVKLSENRIKEVAAFAKRNKIGVVVVNSNEAQRDAEDSFDEMKKYAKQQAYEFNYVVDKNSELADAFGATKTPHIFLFNKSGLAYKGAIDDNIRDGNEAKEHFLKDAITAIGNDKPVKLNSSKSVGCSIKRLD